MEKENPFVAPKSQAAVEPNFRLLIWTGLTVLTAAFCGAMFGGGIGFAVAKLFPDYYRTVFSSPMRPEVDPVAMGVGQGVTQGLWVGSLSG